MSFTINGVTYSNSDFTGKAYATIWDTFWNNVLTHVSSQLKGTSTTALTIGTGSKSLTIQTGKAFDVGQPVRIAFDASNWMDGNVTAYNSATGALDVDVVAANIAESDPTHSAWTVTVAGGRLAVGSLPLGLSSGGTGAASAIAALANLNPGLRSIQLYGPTTGGADTWTKPTGLRYVISIAIGGGGAGGNTTTNMGGGGGAGGIAIKLLAAAALASSVSITVGAGGAAVGNGGTGGSGGTSSFGSHCSATGGLGGAASNPGGAGGAGLGGDINIPGGPGMIRDFQQIAGEGGSSMFGSGGLSSTGAGNNGRGYGGGGSGAGSGSSGAGAPGAVIVLEIF